MLSRFRWFAFLALAAGCSEHQECPGHSDCPQGTTCKCDRQGRLAIELRDLDKDGKPDSVKHHRNEAGFLIGSDTDFGDDGSIERFSGYELDGDNRRLKRKGWQQRCDGSKFFWECSYAEPCPPPYDACAPCPNKFTEEKGDKIVPCGAQKQVK